MYLKLHLKKYLVKNFGLFGGHVQYDNAAYEIFATLVPIINKWHAALWPGLAT
jgi:hypothetical protein